MFGLPPEFVRTVESTFGEAGKQFIANLPALVEETSARWGLAHAVLSVWWGIEDNTGWDYSLAFAEMVADLPLV